MSTTPGTTLLLDQSRWDLCADVSGNIALASPPYALAQDAASAIRLFLGECWYDTTQGIPYLTQILGKYPPLSLIKAQLVAAALTVPGVVSARVFITGFAGRVLSGQVQVTDASGVVVSAGFGGQSVVSQIVVPPIVVPTGNFSSDFDASFA